MSYAIGYLELTPDVFKQKQIIHKYDILWFINKMSRAVEQSDKIMNTQCWYTLSHVSIRGNVNMVEKCS